MRRPLALAAILLLGACAHSHAISPRVESAAGAFASSEPVEVMLANFDFTPPVLHLRAGRPYRLTFTDVASGGHDYSAPAFFAAARVAPQDAAKVAGGEVELKGGESKTVHVIPAAGRYKVVCTHLGHMLLGMKGEIVVD